MVASIATSPTLSITASRIGPRSDRSPTLARLIGASVEVGHLTSQPMPCRSRSAEPSSRAGSTATVTAAGHQLVSTQACALLVSTWSVAWATLKRSRSIRLAASGSTSGPASAETGRHEVRRRDVHGVCQGPHVQVVDLGDHPARRSKGGLSRSVGSSPVGACWPRTATTSRPEPHDGQSKRIPRRPGATVVAHERAALVVASHQQQGVDDPDSALRSAATTSG